MSQIARIAISNCNKSVLSGWQRPVVASVWSQQVNFEIVFFPLGQNRHFEFSFFRLPEPWLPLSSRRTLTPPPNSLVLVLPPSESLVQEQELDLSSVPLSSVMPVTLPSSNSSFHTLSWDSPCPRLWVFSVWWWPSCFCSLFKLLV